MNRSDFIADFINKMLDESDGIAELQRNELATKLSCVPSQINYVITSRFTPEQGYTVESRRGGGGFIRISRIRLAKNNFIMHIVNSIGPALDFMSAKAILINLFESAIIDANCYKTMCAALSPRNFMMVDMKFRPFLTAACMKSMLLSLI